MRLAFFSDDLVLLRFIFLPLRKGILSVKSNPFELSGFYKPWFLRFLLGSFGFPPTPV